MSSDIDKHIVHHQYLAHNGEDLLSQVQKVVCLITQNAIISAGYHPSGEVLLVKSHMLKEKNWDADFVKNELLNDPLYVNPEMVKSIFVASSKNMLVPEELFSNELEIKDWLGKIYHCEYNEEVLIEHFPLNHLYCAYAIDKSILETFQHYLPEVPVLPLTIVHFKNKVNDVLQCTISNTYAKATLHFNNQLLWHQTFDYESAEDILYQLTAACQENQLDIQDYLLSFTTTSAAQNDILNSLKCYFPNFKLSKSGIADIIAPEWSSTVFLFQQLYGCVS